MGNCCFRGMAEEPRPYIRSRRPTNDFNQSSDPTVATPVLPMYVNSFHAIDELVLDLLKLFYVMVDKVGYVFRAVNVFGLSKDLEILWLRLQSSTDNEEESPVSLSKLHMIADKDEGWIQVVKSMINVIPRNDPFGASAITILFDDCPLPTRETVIKLIQLLQLSEATRHAEINTQVERNICVVLGCIAEKLAGPNSIAILNEETLEYLMAMINCNEPTVVLFALIALEKFALTTENKTTILKILNNRDLNPLLKLEHLYNSDNYQWRQVGFCAQWMLDNIFVFENRKLTYESVDMTGINVILNSRDVSEYLKISADGLEARCDSYSFESVRTTFQVDSGAWLYECTIITPGVMQIGWATRNSHFLNHEGYGIGDDIFSIAYDGCRRLVWYKARPSPHQLPPWKPGDTLGCLIDVERKEVLFYLNGKKLSSCKQIFTVSRNGYFAAASFMAFQQCRFNFGHEPFKFPPQNREFNSFNDYGHLNPEQKVVMPRRLLLQQMTSEPCTEDTCNICCDEPPTCTLEPCGHKGFCSVCVSRLKQCPLCRSKIVNVTHVATVTHVEADKE